MMMQSILNQLEINANRWLSTSNDKVAIKTIDLLTNEENDFTYRELLSAANGLSTEFAAYFAINKRIGIISRSSENLVVFYICCLKNKTTAVPLDGMLGFNEINEIFTSLNVRCFFYEEEFSAIAGELERKNKAQAMKGLKIATTTTALVVGAAGGGMNDNEYLSEWVILHSSGTSTGNKKGVIRSEQSTILGAFLHQEILQLNHKSNILCIWPLQGISTFFFLFSALYFGSTCCLVKRGNPITHSTSFTQLFVRHRFDFSTGPALYYEALAKHAKESALSFVHLERLVLLISGSGSSLSTLRMIKQSLKCNIYEAFGSTEAGVITLEKEQAFAEEEEEEESNGVCFGGKSVGYAPSGCFPIRLFDVDLTTGIGMIGVWGRVFFVCLL